jgi:hypothetical protein
MNWDDLNEEKRIFLKNRIEAWDIIITFLKIQDFPLPSKHNCNYLEWKIDSNIIVLYLDEENMVHTIKNGVDHPISDIASAIQQIRTWYKNYAFLRDLHTK